MIKDKLENIHRYSINEYFEVFKAFQKESKGNEYTNIKAPLKAIPLEYNTGTFNLSKFENHKKYIDIHYIIQGQEQIALASTSDLEPNMEYDEINDYQLFDGKIGETINIKEGEFILLFPGEAHVTGGLIGDTSKSLKKVVFKVPV